MKNYLYRIFFGLLVAVFCLGTSQRLKAAEQSLTNAAILEEYTEMARSEFSQIYMAKWCRDHLDERVEESVKKLVASHTEKLLWGTRKIQLSLNIGGVLDAIRADVLADFLPDYEKFIAGVQEEFADSWRSIPPRAFETMVAHLIDGKDPVSQAFLRTLAVPMLADDGKAINKMVAKVLPDVPGAKLDAASISGKAPLLEAWGFGGFLLHIFYDIPAWIAGDFSMDLNDYFARDVLGTCWDVVAEDVRKGLSAALSDREILIRELDEFVTDPQVQELQKEARQNPENVRDRAAELVKKYILER